MNLNKVLLATFMAISTNHFGHAKKGQRPQSDLSIPPFAPRIISTTRLNKIPLPKTESAAQKWLTDFANFKKPKQHKAHLTDLREGRQEAQKILTSVERELDVLIQRRREADAFQKKLATEIRSFNDRTPSSDSDLTSLSEGAQAQLSQRREVLGRNRRRILQMNKQIDNAFSRLRNTQRTIEFTDRFLKWNQTLWEKLANTGVESQNYESDLREVEALIEKLADNRVQTEKLLNDFRHTKMQGEMGQLQAHLLENQINQKIGEGLLSQYIEQWTAELQLLRETCENAPQCANGEEVNNAQRNFKKIVEKLNNPSSQNNPTSNP